MQIDNQNLNSNNLVSNQSSTISPIGKIDNSNIPKNNKPKFFIFSIIILFICIILLTLFTIVVIINKKSISTQNPEDFNPTPSSKTSQQLNPIATDSAYIEAVQKLNQVDQAVSNYKPEDPSLAPPVVELKLGFANE
jgi:hypothetical protein